MQQFIAREIRFYVCVALGYILMVKGFDAPPEGVIERSILISAGILYCLGGLSVGLDLKGVIEELRLLIIELKKTKKQKK